MLSTAWLEEALRAGFSGTRRLSRLVRKLFERAHGPAVVGAINRSLVREREGTDGRLIIQLFPLVDLHHLGVVGNERMCDGLEL